MTSPTPHHNWAGDVTFDPRPHRGKLSCLDVTTVRARFPYVDRFDALRRSLDPDGVFDDSALRAVLGSPTPVT